MRVWLITVGEPLSLDGSRARSLRTGMLADLRADRGHDVTWWTSTFDHARKRHFFDRETVVDLKPRVRLHLLHSVAYDRNVSLRRLANHYGVGRQFARRVGRAPVPDVIVSSMPLVELTHVAARYAGARGIPLMIDVRDLWPDIFTEVLPAALRGLGRLALEPYFRLTRSVCARADAVVAINQDFVDWGLRYAGRRARRWDRVFPLGYSERRPSDAAIAQAEKHWDDRGVRAGEFIVCFFGMMGRQIELETAIGAARLSPSIRFVLCGTGDDLERYRALARDCPNVLFPGWVGADEIWTLMRRSTAGLAPYLSTSSYLSSVPNKPIEYFSAGLPVVSSLDGALRRLIDTERVGVRYERGNSQHLAGVLSGVSAGRRELSANAQRVFEQQFVAEKVYGAMADLVEEVAKQKRSN